MLLLTWADLRHRGERLLNTCPSLSLSLYMVSKWCFHGLSHRM